VARERLVIIRQVHEIEAELSRDGDTAVGVPARVEEQQLRARHERGSHERFGARVRVITVDDDEPGPHAPERSARGLMGLGEVWLMSGELDGGAYESGGERVRGEDQYVLTTQRVSLHEAAGGCRDRDRGCEQEKDHAARVQTNAGGPLTRAAHR